MFFRKRRRKKWLSRGNGIEAVARFVSAESSNVPESHRYPSGAKLVFEITIPGEAPYRVTDKFSLDTVLFARFLPGATLAARVDPEDLEVFIVDWETWRPPAGGDDAIEELRRFKGGQVRSAAGITEGRARISGWGLCGRLFLDEEPLATLDIEVLSSDGLFLSQTKAATTIGYHKVALLIPGATVDVHVVPSAPYGSKVDWDALLDTAGTKRDPHKNKVDWDSWRPPPGPVEVQAGLEEWLRAGPRKRTRDESGLDGVDWD